MVARGSAGAYNADIVDEQVTRALIAIEHGEAGAAERLLPLVYQQLRRLAAARVARERATDADPKHDATSLVHEAYLRVVGSDAPPKFDSRGHFFAAAAEAMRRILVDEARKRQRPKHGGNRRREGLDDERLAAHPPPDDDDVLAVNEALDRLAQEDPDKALVVKLRYFGGLSIEECAAALGISTATAKRRWAFARAWLYAALHDAKGR